MTSLIEEEVAEVFNYREVFLFFASPAKFEWIRRRVRNGSVVAIFSRSRQLSLSLSLSGPPTCASDAVLSPSIKKALCVDTSFTCHGLPRSQALLLLVLSSSSPMTSHAVALATAVAVSGTVILIALCRQKPFSVSAGAAVTADRNSIYAGNTGNTRKKQQQRKKRVQFAAEVAEFSCSEPAAAAEVENQEEERSRSRARGMPANRVALYNGILRDRVMQRMACCY
ncbi:hypothetical protein B296_00039656 [Ensete ventricosum]|uniref:Uncharacterized protein n=1 Tax=Ensete ventricosum TaxID=4639 RepID=A0A426YPW9_ENSVE|nr:hypothetical protein B296_00039656 [Ensete ventricosum]